MSEDFEYTDIGHGVRIGFAGWHPDRELNPHTAHLPEVEKYTLLLEHECVGGERRPNGCVLDGPVSQELDAGRPRWQVVNWEPLTLSPSLLCLSCGLHGFIRDGQWIPA